MNEEHKSSQEKTTEVVGALIGYFVLLVLCLSPGMLVITIIRAIWNLDLDAGQMWTFATLLALACFGMVWLVMCFIEYQFATKDEKLKDTVAVAFAHSILVYGGGALLIMAVSLVLHFGFKVKALGDAIGRFFQ